MNDYILNKAMTLFFIMIGINGFLLMGATLYDTSGQPLDIFYGLNSNGLASDIQDQAEGIGINEEVGVSSSQPADGQGFTPITSESGSPIGIDFFNYIVIGVAGLNLVMLTFAGLFPIMAPIFYAVAYFGFGLQIFVAAYLGSQLVRAIFGRFK